MTKGRICLIYTGGTIGMVRDPENKNELRPPQDPNDFLELAPDLDKAFDYEFVPLLNKDSTNMVPADWTMMAEEIHRRRNDGYDGFVVAHGTDTMHFSSSAVAFALGPELPFPVVFTGAQTIPEVRHGDARVNLMRAFEVAVSEVAEVVIAFGDYVFRGCRAQKKDERRFDAFESPAMFPLGFITEEIVLSPLALRRPRVSAQFRVRPHFAAGVLQVSLIPGLEPELLRPAIQRDECRGLILSSFGAGNVPNVEPYSFAAIIREATQMGKPVIVTSQFPANATLHTAYQPGREAVSAGAIATGNMTASCAATKFRWALALAEEEGVDPDKLKTYVETIMGNAYVGEMD